MPPAQAARLLPITAGIACCIAGRRSVAVPPRGGGKRRSGGLRRPGDSRCDGAASAGSTTYVGDAATGRIVKHIEAWDANPREVVTRLLRPSRNPPETVVERFMAAVARGDGGAAWLAAAGPLLFVLAPDAALTSAGYYIWPDGGVGTFLFWLQAVLWGLVAACAVTEGYRRVRGGGGGGGAAE